MKETFRIPGTFQGTVNLDIVVQVIVLVDSLKKENRVKFKVKIKFGQTRLTHASQSYTLPECTNKPGYVGTFCME